MSIEDKKAEVHTIGVTKQNDVELDRGPTDSQRTRDPFEANRVAEITKKISIGDDLTPEQKGRVHKLIREFADVFALSLSEVWPVKWHKHHLAVDQNARLPTWTSQRPLQENQKEWFYKQLDEMEATHIIQKVPGEFIKNLGSMNLQPKDAGKMGATRTKILHKVNKEC
jgi:hypothetical protein